MKQNPPLTIRPKTVSATELVAETGHFKILKQSEFASVLDPPKRVIKPEELSAPMKQNSNQRPSLHITTVDQKTNALKMRELKDNRGEQVNREQRSKKRKEMQENGERIKARDYLSLVNLIARAFVGRLNQ
jgi:hypothetical protein